MIYHYRVNIFTSLVLAAIVFLAWYFGIQAVNNSETKGYHYGFIVLYSFQVWVLIKKTHLLLKP